MFKRKKIVFKTFHRVKYFVIASLSTKYYTVFFYVFYRSGPDMMSETSTPLLIGSPWHVCILLFIIFIFNDL